MGKDKIDYDAQASIFDKRAGIPEQINKKIAERVLEYGGASSEDLVVEIGAGTGAIGQWIYARDVKYVGLDSSEGMLKGFKDRLIKHGQDTSAVMTFDADRQWPFDDRSAKIVFGARVFHLLDVVHVVAEAKRIAVPGGTLIVGRIKRKEDSPKSAIRQKMRELLEEHGLTPRAADKRRMQLLEEAEALGGKVLGTMVAAKWQVINRPDDSIEGWNQKESMGGINPPPDMKDKIIQELRQWAEQTYGSLTAEIATTERFVLEGVRWP